MTFRMVVLRDPTAMTANQNSLMQVLENVRQQQDAFTVNLRQPSEREIFQRYLDASTAFRQEQLEVIRLAGEGQRQAATDILNGPIDKLAIELGARSGQLLDFYLHQYQPTAAWSISGICPYTPRPVLHRYTQLAKSFHSWPQVCADISTDFASSPAISARFFK